VEQNEYTMHKGLLNVSDTFVYILGWVFLLVGFGVDVLAVHMHSAATIAIGIALNWVGIILAFFSGVIGNRKVPLGFEDRPG
jgi:hypothetical protein